MRHIWKIPGSILLNMETPPTILRGEAVHGATECVYAIHARMWDVALDLIQHHRLLAFAVDCNMISPVLALAYTPPAFPSGNGLSFWKLWIYSGMHIKSADETSVNILSGQVRANGPVRALLLQLLPDLCNLLGLKHLYEIKFAHLHYSEILHHICEEIPNLYTGQWIRGRVTEAIFLAIKEGNFEFVYEIVRRNSDLIWSRDGDGGTIFMAAVRYRQAKIFSLIYQLNEKHQMLTSYDKKGNCLLHVAGMLPPSFELNHLPGAAALQMAKEVQWFKEVESISYKSCKILQNNEGKTAYEVFVDSHEKLTKEGEEWMCDIIHPCGLVGGFIFNIMFAAWIVLRGNPQHIDLSASLGEKWFILFTISSILSFLFSLASVLRYIGIALAGFVENDFREPIVILLMLFISIVTMIVAFCAAILHVVGDWILLPLVGLGIWLGVSQNSFLTYVINLGCGPSIFNRKLLTYMFNLVCGPNFFDRKMQRWF